MIADQHIRDQVLDVGLSFIVQAPAGSGKTSLLVQRYLSLLAQAQEAPEEILALTFTRKAAAEMRNRIIAALQLGQQEIAPPNAYEQKIWSLARKVLQRDQQASWDILDNPARLKIQTIDALSSSIACQLPILSQFGALPNIEPQGSLLYEQAIDQFLQEAHNPIIQQALNNLLLHLDNDRIKLKKLLGFMLAIREQWLPTVVHNMQPVEMHAYLEQSLQLTITQALDDVQASIPEQLDLDLLPLDEADDLNLWLQIADILLTKEGEWRLTVTAQQGFPAPSAAKNKQEKEQLKATKDAMLAMLKALRNCDEFKRKLIAITKLPPSKYTEEQWLVLDSIFTLLPVVVAHLTTVFKDTGKVDFSAVSLAALQALGSAQAPSDLMLALDCKIRHLLIDEFQDTSITQFNLLEKITANWDPYEGRTLFLVGDPMQSIYRFRKAEVGLFLQAQKFGISNISLQFVCLTVNFRSEAAIINWINRVFVSSFPAQDDITYGAIKYMPAEAANVSSVEQPPFVVCKAVTNVQQSNEITTIIKQVKSTNPTASIAILVRAKSHLFDLLPVLRMHNIAYQALEIESLAERPMIQDLLALTKALLHLDDRIAWLAILRAPWCGLNLDDLDLIAAPRLPIWQVLQQAEVIASLSAEAQIRIAHVVKVLDAVLQQSGRKTIDQLAQIAWQNLGGPSCVTVVNEMHEAETFFELLTKLAQQREIYEPGFIEQQLSTLYLKPQMVEQDCVQVMTMHKSKGLEFDVVILPSLNKKTVTDEQRLLLIENRHYPSQHLLLAPIKAAAEHLDPIYKYLAWNEAQRQDYETIRLLYVAATRAKSQLYCLADITEAKPTENSLIGKIWSQVAGEFMVTNPIITDAVAESAKFIRRLPISWFAARELNLPSIDTTDRPLAQIGDDKMRLIGTVVHRVFYQIASEGIEHWDHARIAKQQLSWQQHLSQLGLNAKDQDSAISIIQRAIYNTIDDARGRAILSAKHLETYAEWRLTTTHKYQQFSQIILDRAYLDHDRIFWIVDYKVVGDMHDLEAEVEKYKPQLYKYITAVRKLKPGVSIKAGLYFPLQKEWKQIS